MVKCKYKFDCDNCPEKNDECPIEGLIDAEFSKSLEFPKGYITILEARNKSTFCTWVNNSIDMGCDLLSSGRKTYSIYHEEYWAIIRIPKGMENTKAFYDGLNKGIPRE